MGFFRDLFSTPKPCDMCRLSATRWSRDRSGVIDWSLSGGGLNAALRICPTCAEALARSGLTEKSPILGLAVLTASSIAECPAPYAYLQHAEWRKIWLHTLDALDVNVADELQALDAMKRIQEETLAQVRQSRSSKITQLPDDDLPF